MENQNISVSFNSDKISPETGKKIEKFFKHLASFRDKIFYIQHLDIDTVQQMADAQLSDIPSSEVISSKVYTTESADMYYECAKLITEKSIQTAGSNTLSFFDFKEDPDVKALRDEYNINILENKNFKIL